jgi:hypothetical protein
MKTCVEGLVIEDKQIILIDDQGQYHPPRGTINDRETIDDSIVKLFGQYNVSATPGRFIDAAEIKEQKIRIFTHQAYLQGEIKTGVEFVNYDELIAMKNDGVLAQHVVKYLGKLEKLLR